MQLRHLMSFLAVYEAGGFRSAADAEYLTQPAVSRHVSALEQDLGVRLFDRTAAGAVPTEAGERLYAEVAPTVQALLRSLDNARMSGRPPATARIGYIAPALRGPLKMLLAQMHQEWPDIAVRLHEMNSAGVLSSLRSGQVDIGFLIIDDPAADLIVAPLTRLTYQIVVSSQDELAREADVALHDLDGRVLVTLAAQEPVHARILEVIRQHAPTIRTEPAFGFNEVQSLVAAGLGVAAVPPAPGASIPPGVALLLPHPALPSAVLSVAIRRGWRSPLTQLVGRFGEASQSTRALVTG